jgi:chromosome segregation ATPase
LVKSVLALDQHLSELERVGSKINSTDMNGDFDIDYIRKLMGRFSECGQGVTEEVANLSGHLQAAQTRAESVAKEVSRQAELFSVRRKQQDEKLEEFRLLGERVRALNENIGQFRNDRTQLMANLPAFEEKLGLLIDELDILRKSAKDAHMRMLERNIEALSQSLQAARKKLRDSRL